MTKYKEEKSYLLDKKRILVYNSLKKDYQYKT